MSAVIEDKQAWSRAKQTFRALSAPGMEWSDLTEDQRLYWRNRATDVCGPEPVTMTLWQVTATIGVSEQLPTFYLDSQVQGILTKEDAERVALSIVRRSMAWMQPPRISVMAITYDVVPSRYSVPS